MARSSILLIYTGGTIGMKTDTATGALTPFDFNGIYEEFPSLRRLDIDIEVLPFAPIDSSNVTPELWIALARIIRDNYDRFDGFVVLHGTDTMSYSASALSFMLSGLAKPVVFTGSQIPIGVLRTDGRENLITAIEIAAAKDADHRAIVPEVSLYFQNRLFRANRTTKLSAEELNAFVSYNYPALADVGVNIQYHHAAIHHPAPDEQFVINTALDTNVIVIRLFPGMSQTVLHSLLSIESVRGIVLQTFGSGNAPTEQWFSDQLRRAIEREVVMINTTQCLNGSVTMELYQTGLHLKQIGLISGADMTCEAAVTKMMSVLGQKLSYRDSCDALKKSLRGEISE